MGHAGRSLFASQEVIGIRRLVCNIHSGMQASLSDYKLAVPHYIYLLSVHRVELARIVRGGGSFFAAFSYLEDRGIQGVDR